MSGAGNIGAGHQTNPFRQVFKNKLMAEAVLDFDRLMAGNIPGMQLSDVHDATCGFPIRQTEPGAPGKC